MKMTWFVIFGATAALAAFTIPALGQTSIQSISVVNSGSGQYSQVRTVNSSTAAPLPASSQRQESQVTLPASQLSQPYRLNVLATSAQFSGDVKLNGRTIHRLRGETNSLNLSPHLSTGEHVLEISGNYSPVQGTVQISLVGSGSTLSQQVSGSGQVSSRIRLLVR